MKPKRSFISSIIMMFVLFNILGIFFPPILEQFGINNFNWGGIIGFLVVFSIVKSFIRNNNTVSKPKYKDNNEDSIFDNEIDSVYNNSNNSYRNRSVNSEECEYCGHHNDKTREYCENCGARILRTDQYSKYDM